MPNKKLNSTPTPEISPEMKSWIDNCLVPVLVEEYLAKQEVAKGAGAPGNALLLSAATEMASAAGTP